MFTTYIKQNEIGLLFRRGDFRAVIGPGRHFLPTLWLGIDRLEIFNTLDSRFRHPLLDLLVRTPELSERLEVLDLAEDQRALVWRDNRLFDFVGSGLFAYWKRPAKLRVEKFSVDDLIFSHPQLDAVLALEPARRLLAAVDVEPNERLLVRNGGALLRTLGPGRHAFWQRTGAITWKAVDLREQSAEVQGQEIMTADKVTLRLNLLVTWSIKDPVLATSVVADAATAVYREAQLALRAAVGGRDLERLLADKQSVAGEIREQIARRAVEFGVSVQNAGVRDIVLPGEMKTILNQVIEAQKQAEANLIRRREETAAARSQANTARLLAENPVLLRMKELEAVEGILKGSKVTFVLGQGDLGNQVKGLVAGRDEA
jgi:regulator of protease activity HflC (stomatin/prohibitin superfamily)